MHPPDRRTDNPAPDGAAAGLPGPAERLFDVDSLHVETGGATYESRATDEHAAKPSSARCGLDEGSLETFADAVAEKVSKRLRDSPWPRRGYARAEQVAAHLSVDRSWVYDHKVELGAVQADGVVLFEVSMVEAYLASRRVGSPSASPPPTPEHPPRRPAPDIELIPLPKRAR